MTKLVRIGIAVGVLIGSATTVALGSAGGAGAASPGPEVDVLFETDDDSSGNDEIVVGTWPSLDDLTANTNLTQTPSDLNVSSSYSTTGFHIGQDGTVYVLFETDDDSSGNDEIVVGTWPSLDDLTANTNLTQTPSDLNVSSSYSTTGFHIGQDGTVYVLFETDDDSSGNDEIVVGTWPSLDDLTANTNLTQTPSDLNVSSSYSTTGFHIGQDGTVYVLFETDDDSSGNDEIVVGTWPSLDDLTANTNLTQTPSDLNVSSSYSTTGFHIGGAPDADGDGVPDTDDQCPGQDDTIDVDTDGIPDCIDPLIDSDDDGIADSDDQCPGQDDTIDVDNDGIPDCIDPLIDSDNDGVPDDLDICPGADDTIDVDNDGIPDCIDPLIDSDNDGVPDDLDICPGTNDDPAPEELKKNRNWPTPEDAFGCSPRQIIEAAGLGYGHERFGISNSALEAWLASAEQ